MYDDLDNWDEGFREGKEFAIRYVIEAFAKWLAKDWNIVSKDTLPDIFNPSEVLLVDDEAQELQTMLWEEVKSARRYELKDLQSQVKKLEKKLNKLEEKKGEK